MLYWNDHSTPGTEWLKLSREEMPKDRLWTAEDEKVPYSSWVALPGHNNLGLGRYWHFLTVGGWIVTGLFYVVLLFATPQWQRLIPTSWEIFPQAWDALVTYLHFELPHDTGTFNALQQLIYASVIFILAPLQILTGVAMSPALTARYPWYTKLFGGRQAARSLHFIGLAAFTLFTVGHVAMVVAHGLGIELSKIVLGITHGATPAQQGWTIALAALGLAITVAIHIMATRVSLQTPCRVQHAIQRIIDPWARVLSHRLISAQQFDRAVCIQGWTQIAEWGGVPLKALLDMCGPLPNAHYVLLETFDDKWEEPGHGYFYGTLDIESARDPQTILAYDLNGKPLPQPFGAPLRLRLETQLGYKMTKWVRRIELIEDYRDVGEGYGGWREDLLHYSQTAPI